MLGLGWTEMLVVGVVALIVIGPKELPELMRKLGRFTAQVRRMGGEFQRELNRTTGLDEVRNLKREITKPLKETSDAIRREFNTVNAAGKVEPSGVLKPADPGAESVVKEIREVAGLSPPVAAAAVAVAPPAKSATPGNASQPEQKKKATRKRSASGAAKASAAGTKPASPAKTPARRASKPAAKSENTVAAKPATKRSRKPETVAAPAAGEAEAPKPRAKRAPRRKKTADE